LIHNLTLVNYKDYTARAVHEAAILRVRRVIDDIVEDNPGLLKYKCGKLMKNNLRHSNLLFFMETFHNDIVTKFAFINKSKRVCGGGVL
jgi:hypothetical protein